MPAFAQTVNPEPAPPSTMQSGDENPDAETVITDEVIANGTRVTGQHDGMDAFFNGDFETAEIEFEREFKGLRRFERARESAAEDAALSADRAQAQADAGTNVGSSANSRGGGVPSQSAGSAAAANSGVTSNFSNRRGEGRMILTDGKVTYEDFGFTRYMSGLSEIKLGKFDEAKVSLTQSLRYDESNFDARMRLGLLYLMDDDFEEAAKQLEKIDKQRRRCQRLACDDLETLNNAALELATQITRAVNAG
jgi:tetratricopeptide (TPR) repeat protein